MKAPCFTWKRKSEVAAGLGALQVQAPQGQHWSHMDLATRWASAISLYSPDKLLLSAVVSRVKSAPLKSLN